MVCPRVVVVATGDKLKVEVDCAAAVFVNL